MQENQSKKSPYLKFFLMILTSMVVMYLLTYANSWEIFGHAWFSETRLFMVLMMGGSMAIIMLSFMLGMYRNKKINTAIYVGALVMIAAGIALVRSQETVDDVDYMEGMIPHHSIAILTSNRAKIEDRRVRELADKIVAAQVREIKEMSWLIEDIRSNGTVSFDVDAEKRSVPEFGPDQ